uniref:Uncharacterized protein n=1 Tax=Oryza brachyantha TaxID=4533 RepID=J3MDM6_ORYBR
EKRSVGKLSPARGRRAAAAEGVPEDGPVAARLAPAEQGALPGGVPARGDDAVADAEQRGAEEDEGDAEGDPRRDVHLRHRLEVVERREEPHPDGQRRPHRHPHPPHHPVRHHLRDRRVPLVLLVVVVFIFLLVLLLRGPRGLPLPPAAAAPPALPPGTADGDDLGLRVVTRGALVPAGAGEERGARGGVGGDRRKVQAEGRRGSAGERRWSERQLHGESHVTRERRASYL